MLMNIISTWERYPGTVRMRLVTTNIQGLRFNVLQMDWNNRHEDGTVYEISRIVP